MNIIKTQHLTKYYGKARRKKHLKRIRVEFRQTIEQQEFDLNGEGPSPGRPGTMAAAIPRTIALELSVRNRHGGRGMPGSGNYRN